MSTPGKLSWETELELFDAATEVLEHFWPVHYPQPRTRMESALSRAQAELAQEPAAFELADQVRCPKCGEYQVACLTCRSCFDLRAKP